MNFSELKKIVADSGNIVFFGGAGTSTESDIPDFRSAGGLYGSGGAFAYPPEVMLSRTFFMQHTEQFYEFYRAKMVHPHAKPGAAHLALTELERQGKLRAVITQNIDGLHQKAGSRNVLELHGSVERNTCMECGARFELDYILQAEDAVPKCGACGGTVKPDVVLYEEMLDTDTLLKAQEAVREADILIVGGTSLSVYPAAGLVAEYEGDKLILINKSATPYDARANYLIQDSIGKVLTALISG
ncbi:NAD-dependent protein deacylase [Paenibacillus beijingensis]|uniref:NAD-dependent protein deacetylase n=1 Tax=Paenibacillus beijingensis TaxID=1126833 RepID=A0A0D5NFJ0_9BACL|nr:NAD-dependent protein deacylase [Paenibacillus beijingensis]AJY74129.1 NAD-dependent deacetylase [Paenibacillus beijingensis]